MGIVYPDVCADEDTKKKLKDLIVKEDCAARMLRGAWVSAETVVRSGTMKPSEFARDAKNDLRKLLKRLRVPFPTLTDDDFYLFAGFCAIEVISETQIPVHHGKELDSAVATGNTGGPEISHAVATGITGGRGTSKSLNLSGNNNINSSSRSGNSNDNNYGCHNTLNINVNYNNKK